MSPWLFGTEAVAPAGCRRVQWGSCTCTRPGRCEHACVSLEAAGNGVRAAGGISPQLAGFLLHFAAAAGQHSSKCKRIDVNLEGRHCVVDSGTLFEVATSWFTPWFLFVSPMCGKRLCRYAPASVVLSTCSALLMHNWLCCRPSKPDAG